MSWSTLLWPGSMSPGICLLLFVDDIITILICCNELDFYCRFTVYHISKCTLQNEIVDVILILQMSMECQSFNKTCFLITEWAEKVEHVISLRLAFDCAEFHRQQNSPIIPSSHARRDLWQARAAQAFKNVNKIRGIYSAVEWDEPDMRTTESRHHTLDSDQHQGWSCPCSKWMVFVQDFTCQTHQYLAALAWRQHWSFCYQPAYSESKLIFLHQSKYPQTLSDNETSIW